MNENEENETSSQADVSLTREIDNENINQPSENNRNEKTDPDFQNFNFDTSVSDRKFSKMDDIETEEITSDETPFTETYNNYLDKDKALLWHVRLGHASLDYLRSMQRKYPDNKSLCNADFHESIKDCEICMVSKFNKLSFNKTRERATRPLEVIHSDTMGPISPQTHPKGYRYISVFIDDYSKLAMAYPMRTKSETGECLEAFIKSGRNLLGFDVKVCYLQSDQGTEFTGGYTIEVLNKIGAESRFSCPDTPEHNGVAERFNQTIQKKVRSYMFDSKLPENMWDLALGAATYAYNSAPYKSINMEIPIQKFELKKSFEINQLTREPREVSASDFDETEIC